MPETTVRLTSRARSCFGKQPGGPRDTVLELNQGGLFAVITAEGPTIETELAARSVREILRRSLEPAGLTFAERMLIAEEALDSILWVLQNDAEAKGLVAPVVSFVVALIAGGWLGVLCSGAATAHVYRSGGLFRLLRGDDDSTTTGIAKRITATEPRDRLFFSSACLAEALDEGSLASEHEISDLLIVDRVAEKYAGARDVSAIAVMIDA